MAIKRVYYIAALTLFLLGIPVLNYFAYSNERGDITIMDKSWTDFCNATSWDNPADIICSANNNFIANNDTFWYPIGYDLYGRQEPASFKPSIKEWKFERKWGDGWREIYLTKPCNATYCGKGKYPVLYSVVWRKGKTYETRIQAIKENPEDAIYWSFGDTDPFWFGIDIGKLEDCHDEMGEIKIPSTYIYYYNYTEINNITNINISRTDIKVIPFEITKQQIISICRTTGMTLNQHKINFTKCNINCQRNNKIVSCDDCSDGNCDGKLNSGESGIKIDLTQNLKKQLGSWKGDTPKISERLRDCVK